jgi:hypothetical protein
MENLSGGECMVNPDVRRIILKCVSEKQDAYV